MATGCASAEQLPDGVDWAKLHRPPAPNKPLPAVPATGTSNSANLGGADIGRGRRQSQSRTNQDGATSTAGGSAATRAINGAAIGPSRSGSDEAAARVSREGSRSSRPRRRSFSFLRRSKTSEQQSRDRAADGSRRNSEQHHNLYTDPTPTPTPTPPPPPPQSQPRPPYQSRFLQAQNERANSNMLRKASSKLKKGESSEKKQEHIPRQPPHLPSLQPLHDIASFGDDSRPDSVAIFNQAYRTSASPPSQPRTVGTNFSRPGHAMAPSSTTVSSSSPAYTARYGPAGSSSPPDHNARVNGGGGSGEYVVIDSNSRTDSMTNRGRFSYASSMTNVNSVNSPRRVRRRKDPTPFNILVIGAKNSGKTSFISFLKHSLALPSHKQPSERQPDSQTGGNRSSFTSTYLETDSDGERVGLTLWDSAGLEKNIVDLQLREMAAFVEAKFEDTFAEEQKVMRTPGVKDTHIHCIFLLLDPVRLDSTIAGSAAFQKKGQHSGSLDDDLDLQVMRALWGKTTVIPIISKADTLTSGRMAFLKRAVWEALKGAKLDPLEALELEDDLDEEDEDADDVNGVDSAGDSDSVIPVPKTRRSHKRQSSLSAIQDAMNNNDETPYIPMSILSPDPYDLPSYVSKSKVSDKLGRRFPWGFADPYDPEHCDFNRLRDSIFSEWRTELRELSRSRWYENWRTSRLKNFPGSRQRLKGGVTPVAAVPREGRMASQSSRQVSPPQQQTGSVGAVPRSVSNLSKVTSAQSVGLTTMGSTNGGVRGPSGADDVGSVRNGTLRSGESQRLAF